MAGLFVTGTDTGVGKTFVSCAIARGLRERGIDVGVMKPIETGVPEAGPEDARALIAAAGIDDPIERVCPIQYAMPAAPEASARAEARPVEIETILRAHRELDARHAFMLVEGAGGLLVPLNEKLDMSDLAVALGLPVLLVARTTLGTINHTLLSIEACRQRNLPLLGVVLSHAGGILSAADAANLELLRERLGGSLIGEVGPVAAGDVSDPIDAGVEEIMKRLSLRSVPGIAATSPP